MLYTITKIEVYNLKVYKSNLKILILSPADRIHSLATQKPPNSNTSAISLQVNPPYAKTKRRAVIMYEKEQSIIHDDVNTYRQYSNNKVKEIKYNIIVIQNSPRSIIHHPFHE
jgi:hypothetical protein